MALVCGVSSVRQIAFCFGKMLRAAEVAPVGGIGAEAVDLFTLFGEPYVRIDDGKRAALIELREDARRDHVNSAEGQRLNSLPPRSAA